MFLPVCPEASDKDANSYSELLIARPYPARKAWSFINNLDPLKAIRSLSKGPASHDTNFEDEKRTAERRAEVLDAQN